LKLLSYNERNSNRFDQNAPPQPQNQIASNPLPSTLLTLPGHKDIDTTAGAFGQSVAVFPLKVY
jgi:hypothetical protein